MSPFHSNFVRYIGHFQYVDLEAAQYTLNIIVAPVAHSDLAKRLRRVNWQCDPALPGPLADENAKAALRELSKAWVRTLAAQLFTLHTYGRARHKDLKPDNILVYSRQAVDDTSEWTLENNQLFVADFGISHDFLDNESSKTHSQDRGRTNFSAPEVHDEGGIRGTKADIFSLGCIFLEIFALLWDIPRLKDFTNTRNTRETYAAKVAPARTDFWLALNTTIDQFELSEPLLEDGKYASTEEHRRTGTTRFLLLIKEMLQNDPDDRPFVDDVVERSFSSFETRFVIETRRTVARTGSAATYIAEKMKRLKGI